MRILQYFLKDKSIGATYYDLPLDPPCGTWVPNSPRAGMQQGQVIFSGCMGDSIKLQATSTGKYMSA